MKVYVNIHATLEAKRDAALAKSTSPGATSYALGPRVLIAGPMVCSEMTSRCSCDVMLMLVAVAMVVLISLFLFQNFVAVEG